METVLEPLLAVAKLLTIQSYTVGKQKNRVNIKKHRKTFCYYLRTAALIISTTFCVIYKQTVQPIDRSEGIIIVSAKFLQINCKLLIVSVSLLIANLSSQKIINFLKSVVEVENRFSDLGINLNYASIKKVAYVLFAWTVFKVVVPIIPYLFKAKWTTNDYLDLIMDLIILYIPNFIIYAVVMQWIVYLYLLHLELESLNGLLNKLMPTKGLINPDKSTEVLREKRHNQRSSHKIIENTALMYDSLFQQAEYINKTFVWQMLVIVPSLFILTIYNSFYICQMIKHKVDFNFRIIILNCFYVISFLELVTPCVKVKGEAGRIFESMQRIIVNEEEEDMSDMLYSVALQIYHQKIEFSVFGALQIDGTLLYSICGAITTYLVVLLQFDIDK